MWAQNKGSENAGPVDSGGHKDLGSDPSTSFGGPSVWESSGKPRMLLSSVRTLILYWSGLDNQDPQMAKHTTKAIVHVFIVSNCVMFIILEWTVQVNVFLIKKSTME